ncbi:hypothetical protein CPB83DRAFT_853225 [Crepidotus variabilis]|uniref:RING-CH-type domain-containing protein n=1 Tax=Crepidotus variabilis TaxID=179855 RepID=A0A9P6JR21_9AGAR|nr:hypothetical protein CPB83DRAFT_853225 [Crepidotus variabilis]
MASNPQRRAHETQSSATTGQRVPTINDLRVKQCYICMEEERSDTPTTQPPRAWTHPCSCTLVAHADCLLKWIQSSQATSSRAPNALKCPQCGTAYELISKEPFLLKLLGTGNKVLQKCGTWFTLLGVATAAGVAGTSIYICLTAYGAYALEKFIGREMFDLILTDDPTNWPWSAYINLPLIPLSLIASRFTPTSSLSPAGGASASSFIIPLLLVWPPSQPVGEPARRMYEYWSRPENARRLTELSLFGNNGTRMSMWPPPPILFGLFGIPLVKALYRRAYARLYKRVLGSSVQQSVARRANPGPPNGNAPNDDEIRIDEGPIVIRIVARGGNEPAQPVDANADADANAPAAQNVPVAAEEEDPDAANVQAAEQFLNMSTSSLGRRIGGALLVPVISNMMGGLLLRLSKRSVILQGILGVSHASRMGTNSTVRNWLIGDYTGPGSGSVVERALPTTAFSQPRRTSLTESEPEYPYPPLSWTKLFLFSSPYGTGTGAGSARWKDLSIFQQTRVGLKLVVNAMLGGSRIWVESDPVWWRNSLGFALFCAIKDAIHLLHLYLKKKELESRKVVNRDFSGVDFESLDLIPGFLQEEQASTNTNERRISTEAPSSVSAKITPAPQHQHESEVELMEELDVVAHDGQ